MSLTKTAMAIGLLVLLLPTDKAQQERLYQQVSTAAHWTVTFCDRNAATCEQASRTWDVFRRKAAFGGQLAYDLLQSALAEKTMPASSASPLPDTAPLQPSRGTLTPEDMRPRWRGVASPDQGA